MAAVMAMTGCPAAVNACLVAGMAWGRLQAKVRHCARAKGGACDLRAPRVAAGGVLWVEAACQAAAADAQCGAAGAVTISSSEKHQLRFRPSALLIWPLLTGLSSTT